MSVTVITGYGCWLVAVSNHNCGNTSGEDTIPSVRTVTVLLNGTTDSTLASESDADGNNLFRHGMGDGGVGDDDNEYTSLGVFAHIIYAGISALSNTGDLF